MALFKIIDKNTEECFDVYDVAYDKKGYPHFLIYLGKAWTRVSAKQFRPVADERIDIL